MASSDAYRVCVAHSRRLLVIWTASSKLEKATGHQGYLSISQLSSFHRRIARRFEETIQPSEATR